MFSSLKQHTEFLGVRKPGVAWGAGGRAPLAQAISQGCRQRGGEAPDCGAASK